MGMAVGDRWDDLASRFGLGSEIDRREHAELEERQLPTTPRLLFLRCLAAGLLLAVILEWLWSDGHLSFIDVMVTGNLFGLGLYLQLYLEVRWRRRHQGRNAG
jgi:hypothetical protein